MLHSAATPSLYRSPRSRVHVSSSTGMCGAVLGLVRTLPAVAAPMPISQEFASMLAPIATTFMFLLLTAIFNIIRLLDTAFVVVKNRYEKLK